MKRRDPKADLFTLWRAVFAEAKPTYDEALFARVLDRLSGDPQVSAALRSLVHDTLQDPSAALRAELHHVGVETALAGVGRDQLPEPTTSTTRPSLRSKPFCRARASTRSSTLGTTR